MMKRMHLHVKVDNLKHSIAFYSALFDAPPTVAKPNYAKWMVDDPRINFAISLGGEAGLNHLGIQAETPEELTHMQHNLAAASIATLAESGAKCCYAHSDKHWAKDPSGLAWEMYRTMDTAEIYGDEPGDQHALAATEGAKTDAAEASCTSGCVPGEARDRALSAQPARLAQTAKVATNRCCG